MKEESVGPIVSLLFMRCDRIIRFVRRLLRRHINLTRPYGFA